MNNTKKYSLVLTFALLLSMLAASSVFVTAPAAAQASKDWPMYRYDAANTGWNPNSLGPAPLALKWSYRTGDSIRSSPAIVNQKVYIGSNDFNLYCLDGDTGEELWKYRTDNSIRSSPAVIGGKVYFGSYDTYVYCLDANSGSLIWRYKTGLVVPGSPCVANNRVYIISNDNHLYCLDANTGAQIWNFTTRGSRNTVAPGDVEYLYHNAKPAVVGGRVYFFYYDRYLYCLNEATGTKIWDRQGLSSPTGSPQQGYRGTEVSPCVAGGAIYIGLTDTRFYKINATDNTGTVIWSKLYNEALQVAAPSDNIIQNSACWPNNGYVYYIYPNPHMACQVNPTNGLIVNMGMMGILPRSSLSGAGDYLYCGNNDRYMYVWDKNDMSRRQSFDVPQIIESTPSLADDKLYFGCNDRNVYCMEHGETKTLNQLTCIPAVRSVSLGTALTVTGAIVPYHLNGPEGQTVTLHFVRPDGTTATATAVTGSAGIYQGTYTPDAEGNWKVKATWDGNPWWLPSTSLYQTFTVTAAVVKPTSTITAAADNATIVPGNHVTISGTITPAVSGVLVTLNYNKPGGSTVTRTSVSGPGGVYEDVYTPDTEGSWSVTASWAGNDANQGATSNAATFNVTPTGTEPTTGGGAIAPEIIYAIVAIIVIVIVAIAAYMYMRRSKK